MAAAVSLLDVPSRGEPPRGETLIELKGVSKEYASGTNLVRAMRDVSMTIMRGEFVAIVGTSGSGKSTMMNILGCLDRPTRGTYTLADIPAGERINDARALIRNRLIGFIFQGFNLLPRTTALENVELPLQYRGIGARTRRKRAMAALESVALGDRVHHTPNQLSGGQQQRVAIARALVTDPPLLLADEPTGNLDTRTSLEVLALLQRLNRDRGITIVLVTHEQDIAACASRVITMRDGRIVTDVVQDKPLDAAAELAALPPPNDQVGAHVDVEADPVEAAKQRIGGPVPFSVYAMMFVGSLLGLAVAAAYNAVILKHPVAWISWLGMALGEAWFASRRARKKLGRPLTTDQRARLAIWYTVGFVLVALAFVALLAATGAGGFLYGVAAPLEHLTSRAPLAVGVFVAVLAALSLQRYLFLSLLSPRR
jgi:putative ABC transport system ATP-binding protein